MSDVIIPGHLFSLQNLHPVERAPVKLAGYEPDPSLPTFREVLAHSSELRQSHGIPDNAPQNIYAQIWVGDVMVGEVYKGGSCTMTNEAAARVKNLADDSTGLELAQTRTDQIAVALGGEIRYMNGFGASASSDNTPASKPAQNPVSMFGTKVSK